ncbi:MAG TPA: alpha/beta hydrolase [Stellaceae bacterium]|jgi:hypothetical protein|nr:alpha/beta hydrolase [Stellaceae bacterium]
MYLQFRRSGRRPVRAEWCAILLAFAATALSGAALGQTAPAAAVVSDVPVAGGTERVLFLGGRQARAIVLLLPGGDGIIGLDSGGGVHQLGGNFLLRTLGHWVAQGFAVVLPDAPNGTSLAGQRHLPAYADAISRAIDFGRSRAALPVWLIGTSAGTTAAVNGAAHLGSKVSGAVLTSSATRRPGSSGETIFDAEPGAVAVPVLVVSNEYDTCPDTPPGDAPMVLSALTRSPRKELVMVRSGQTAKRSDPCQGMSPHGYLGIEDTVVQRISEWIRAAGGG